MNEHDESIEREAFEQFHSGFCCAESVLRTTLRRFAPDAPPEVSRMATGFVGGIGKTKEDVCGALVGGIMALGYLRGRDELGQDITPLLEISTAYRAKFLEHYGSTSCPKLLEKFGEQEDMMECKHMVAHMTAILAGLIEQERT